MLSQGEKLTYKLCRAMPLDLVTRTVLEHYTKNPPATEDVWYGPWIAILTSLFPVTQGYLITPRHRIPDDGGEGRLPDLVLEVVRLTTPPFALRTVLIVKVRNSQHWRTGIPALERQLTGQIDAAFANTSFKKVYWIGAIGPHWRYGVKDDEGQGPVPLIDWHDTTHDQGSFGDLQVLTGLVAAL